MKLTYEDKVKIAKDYKKLVSSLTAKKWHNQEGMLQLLLINIKTTVLINIKKIINLNFVFRRLNNVLFPPLLRLFLKKRQIKKIHGYTRGEFKAVISLPR